MDPPCATEQAAQRRPREPGHRPTKVGTIGAEASNAGGEQRTANSWRQTAGGKQRTASGKLQAARCKLRAASCSIFRRSADPRSWTRGSSQDERRHVARRRCVVSTQRTPHGALDMVHSTPSALHTERTPHSERARSDDRALPRVELRGLEPLTPCMPCRCATSCATAPRTTTRIIRPQRRSHLIYRARPGPPRARVVAHDYECAHERASRTDPARTRRATADQRPRPANQSAVETDGPTL